MEILCVNIQQSNWPWCKSVESCSCRVRISTHFHVIRTCYCDIVLIIWFNKWLINFIGVGFFMSYCYSMLNILFTICSYTLNCVATGCSSPYCKECQTQHLIHRKISYTVECREVNILFKIYNTLCDTSLELL